MKISRQRPINRYILPSDEEGQATFLWHPLRRKEFMRMMELLDETKDEKGDIRFTLKEAFALAQIVLVGCDGIQDEDGTPLKLAMGEGGVALEDLDLFELKDVMQFAAHVMQSAKMDAEDTGK